MNFHTLLREALIAFLQSILILVPIMAVIMLLERADLGLARGIAGYWLGWDDSGLIPAGIDPRLLNDGFCLAVLVLVVTVLMSMPPIRDAVSNLIERIEQFRPNIHTTTTVALIGLAVASAYAYGHDSGIGRGVSIYLLSGFRQLAVWVTGDPDLPPLNHTSGYCPCKFECMPRHDDADYLWLVMLMIVATYIESIWEAHSENRREPSHPSRARIEEI